MSLPVVPRACSPLADVLGEAWWGVPTGPDQTLSMQRGLRVQQGIDPAYSVELACWRTYVDLGDRHGPRLFRPKTQDESQYLLAAPGALDIETLGGFDLEVSFRATHPCLTISTLAYLLNQSITGMGGPISDVAVGFDRQGRLFAQWQDSGDAFHVVKFGPELGFIPPVDRYDVRVAGLDNGDATGTFWGWHKFDHDGPWLPLTPYIGDGSSIVSLAPSSGLAIPGLTDEAPDFVTREGALMMGGYARGELFGFVAREPSEDPVDAPGAVVFSCDLADGVTDGVGVLPGGTFESNGDEYLLGAESLGVVIEPAESGWLFIESDGLVDAKAIVPAEGWPDFQAGSFTLGVRFTPTAEGSSAQYVRTVEGSDLPAAGILVGDLSAESLGHVVFIADGSGLAGDFGIELSSWEPHDLVIVRNDVTKRLIVYVDGVAREPVDLSSLDPIENTNAWKFSGGGEVPTVLHPPFLVDRACTAAEVAVLRSRWTG